MIHRISEQKGFQLLLEASEGIFKNLGYQAIIGGGISAGDTRGETIAHGLYLLSTYYPGKVNVSFGFQDISIPLLSSDYFLMPSMHEPGGISQIEAMAAGCPVIARATGGLRDTIKPIMDNGGYIEGNGFLFSDFSPWSFYDAMERASSFFHKSDDSTFNLVRKAAEESAYYWDKPAREYIKLIYDLTETIRITRQRHKPE
jgi:starch synthase